MVKEREARHAAVHESQGVGHDYAIEQQKMGGIKSSIRGKCIAI